MRSSALERAGRGELERDIERLHPACYSWALSCCGWDRAEAEDVLQTAYLKLLDGRAAFSAGSSLRTFAFSVIRHTAADRRRRRMVITLGLAALMSRTPEQAGDGGDAAERVAVRRALASLPARQHEVLELVFFQGLTLDEAAEVMGVSAGTARAHYQRGKTRLEQVLA